MFLMLLDALPVLCTWLIFLVTASREISCHTMTSATYGKFASLICFFLDKPEGRNWSNSVSHIQLIKNATMMRLRDQNHLSCSRYHPSYSQEIIRRWPSISPNQLIISKSQTLHICQHFSTTTLHLVEQKPYTRQWMTFFNWTPFLVQRKTGKTP